MCQDKEHTGSHMRKETWNVLKAERWTSWQWRRDVLFRDFPDQTLLGRSLARKVKISQWKNLRKGHPAAGTQEEPKSLGGFSPDEYLVLCQDSRGEKREKVQEGKQTENGR